MIGLQEFKRRLYGLPRPHRPSRVRQFKDALEGRGPMPKRRWAWPGRTTRLLKEECQCGEADVDAGEPVIRNVKVLGSDSLNRRKYTPEAMQQAAGMYEGRVVNFDHPDGNPSASRRVADRFGRLANVRMVDGELRADLRYNPRHPLAGAVKWFAENDPDCLGLSHNAVGQGRTVNGIFVVEKIVSVRSVDLVADPATTKGLFQ